MATTYELRKALYKTIEDELNIAGQKAQIIAFDNQESFAVEIYIEIANTINMLLSIDSNGKYSVNLNHYPSASDIQFGVLNAAGEYKVLIQTTGASLGDIKVRKEIKYGVIKNPSIQPSSSDATPWVSVQGYVTQLENLIVDGNAEITGNTIFTGTVDINNSTNIDGANIHLGGTTEVDVVTPLLDIDATNTTIDGTNLDITVTTTDVVGNVNIDGAVDVDGSLNVDNINLDLNKITTLTGDLTIDSATNETIIDSNTTITGTLDTTGAAEFDSTVGIDGNVRVGVDKFNINATTGGFIADGLAELDGGINTNDVFTVSTAGAIYTASSLEVDGSTRLDGTVDINNSLDLDATSLSLRTTQISEVLLDANDTTNRTMTISAVNAGTGEASILVTADESITMISNDAFINATNIGITGVTNIDGNTTIDGTTVHLGTTGTNNEIDFVTTLLDIDATDTTIDGTNLDITVTTTDIVSDVNITGSLDVDNININENTITSTGNLIINSTTDSTTIQDNVSITGTLGVTGVSTFTGNINATGGIDVNDLFIVDTAGNIDAVTYNNITITPPATGATLTIAEGTTLTINESLNTNNIFTIAAEDGSTAVTPADVVTITGGTLLTSTIAGQNVTVNHDAVTRTDATSSITPDAGSSFTVVDSVSSTTEGHLTAINVKTVTLPTYDIYTDNNTTSGVVDIHLNASGTGTDDLISITGADEITVTQSGDLITIDHDNITRTNTTSILEPDHSATFTVVDSITSNARGHLTGVNTKTVTMPAVSTLDEVTTAENSTSNTIIVGGLTTGIIGKSVTTESLSTLEITSDNLGTGESAIDLTADTINLNGNTNISNDLIISGNLTVQGTNTVLNTTTVSTEDTIIELRSGTTSGNPLTGYAGLVAKLYDGTNDGGLLFDANGIAYVGDVTLTNGLVTSFESLQAIATRENTPNSTAIPFWNATVNRFDTNELFNFTTTGSILNIDNLRLDGNTISSTDGNIILEYLR
jgi:hypothetical protein